MSATNMFCEEVPTIRVISRSAEKFRDIRRLSNERKQLHLYFKLEHLAQRDEAYNSGLRIDGYGREVSIRDSTGLRSMWGRQLDRRNG